MAREVCFLIGRDGSLLWADASDDPARLPDSRARWEAIWAHRALLAEIAHSHPHGPCTFSAEDETTMLAIGRALAEPPAFSVVSPQGVRRRSGNGEERMLDDEPWWAALMRHASGMHEPRKPEEQ